ncbi:MAG: hypothetical protein ABIQ18_50575 [Umezawaea sp.]
MGRRGTPELRRRVGAVALVVGAVLAVLGSLLPLFEQVLSFSAEEETYSMTLWGVETSFDISFTGDQPLYGVPVVVAAALLVIAAALVLAAPRLPVWIAGPTSIGAIAAAALLIGAVWTVGQLVLVASAEDGPENVKTTVGAGTGTLVLACVLALAGGLLVQRWPDGTSAAPEQEPEGAVVYRLPDDDVDTPPFGIPISEDTGERGA